MQNQMEQNGIYKGLVKQILTLKSFNKERQLGVDIEALCSGIDFVREVIKTMDVLLVKHGLMGYRDTWYNYHFPLTYYLKFKHYLTESKYFTIEEKIEDGYKENK